MKVTGNVHKIVEYAQAFAKSRGEEVNSIHLIFGITQVPSSMAAQILAERGITAEGAALQGIKIVPLSELLERALQISLDTYKQPAIVSEALVDAIFNGDVSFEQKNNELKSPLPEDILRMGADLTLKARNGKIDKIIGRDEETNRVIEILCRKTKNNPVLIGEAGVGKSAIVEGLALAITCDKVPKLLEGKTIFSLDIGSLMAGTKYRGELEARLEKLLKLLEKDKSIILFIDELHLITTAANKENEIGIGEMLKPKLARGEIQCIGATTTEEYRKYIEKDPALERRFAPIKVEPPTVGEAIEILTGLRESFEKFHNVEIEPDAIVSAVTMSDRYITDRNLPDKAIDMLDEACAKKRVIQSNDKITAENIAEVIAKTTGIPVTKLNNDEKEKLQNIEIELQKHIIGQDNAISAIAKAIRRARSGVADANRPIGSFMFLGRTGVGKTEVCKQLAELLYSTDKALIKLDMSEFSESHSVSKLIGSPPGYVGYDDASALCERVRRNPYCLVLFDEIEKAHPDVYNVLLQILDEGRLTDNKGKTTSFKNALIVLTSNVGVENLSKTKKIGFSGNDDEQNIEERAGMMAGLKKRFKPEFINRIDNVIVFESLSKESVAKIAQNYINKLKKKLDGMNISLTFNDDVINYLVECGYDYEYGARPLRRLVQTEIEDKIAEQILSSDVKKVSIILKDKKLEFNIN